jgi:alkaline phosphatase
MSRPPKSPEPTAVGAVSSAFTVDIAAPAWLSYVSHRDRQNYDETAQLLLGHQLPAA